MTKLTLEEKRLQNLRRQLFGATSTKKIETKIEPTKNRERAEVRIENPSTEVVYLKKDLSKILILTIFALIIQGSLYLGLNRFNFF